MPVYTYRCDNCGVEFDQTQKFSDPPLSKCPECGKQTLHKVYQPVGIVFKGSGFYATDHRSPSGSSRSSERKAAEGSETKSESKSEPTAPKEATPPAAKSSAE
jgi:putative FmdB family regulatory protein